MSKRKKHQYKKDNKESQKQKIGKWVDKNWQYVLEGWTLIFTFLIISSAIYSIGLNEKNFDISFFLNAVVWIGIILFFVLIIGFSILTILSAKKTDLLYFCLFVSLNLFVGIYLLIYKEKIGFVAAVVIDVIIGMLYANLRIKKKIKNKNISVGLNSVNAVLSIFIPALTTIIAHLLK